jgi:hypothetical protein
VTRLIVVHSYGSRPEADLAVGALSAAGIDAIISADSGGGMRPHLAWAGAGFQVIVREDDVAAARDILELPARERS